MDNIQQGKVIILAIIAGVIVGCFLLFLFLIFVKQKNQVIRSKEKAEENFKQELLKTQTEIQKETMQHIGKEIHDNVGQKLTLSSIYLQQLMYENKFPQLNNTINNVNDIINESLSDLRQLSKTLTNDTVQESSLVELIELESKRVNQLKTCNIEFHNELSIGIESYLIKSVVLRMIQEFIQNSLKHSDCKQIKISISNSINEIEIVLQDDGKGFDINNINSSGIGLDNINKRVKILNGNSKLQSDRTGTILTINIPV